MQQHLFEHFNSEGHRCFLDKISITFIGKKNPSELLKRENYWTSILILKHHGVSMLRAVFELCLFSRYRSMDGLLIGYDSQIMILVLIY